MNKITDRVHPDPSIASEGLEQIGDPATESIGGMPLNRGLDIPQSS